MQPRPHVSWVWAMVTSTASAAGRLAPALTGVEAVGRCLVVGADHHGHEGGVFEHHDILICSNTLKGTRSTCVWYWSGSPWPASI